MTFLITICHNLRTLIQWRNNPYMGVFLTALPLFGADWSFIQPNIATIPKTKAPVLFYVNDGFKAVESAVMVSDAPQQSFSLLNYWPGYAWAALPDNTLSFPRRGGSFPAFVLLTNAVPQDISGGAITATFRIVTSPDVALTFGGEGRWNVGPMPPHARLFFSSYHGYLNESGCPECFWFSADGWTRISNGVFTITATFDPSRWTHSQGQTNAAAFHAALTNCIEAGVCFGGGSFYDIGVGTTNGSATFEMLALDFLPATGALALALTNGLNCVETSIDLTNWTHHATRVGPGVMRIPVGTEAHRFWRSAL